MTPGDPDQRHRVESLRERKKRRTRQAVVDAAAALFAERGYEAVTVMDVARAADVSEQTVYNHFPTKEHLVFDRSEEMEAALLAQVRGRPPGASVTTSVHERAVAFLDMVSGLPADRMQGGMPYLVAASPALRRWGLDLFTRTADALAAALADEQGLPADDVGLRIVARVLLTPLQVAIEEFGFRLRDGVAPAEAVAQLRPAIELAFAALEAGLAGYGTQVTGSAAG